MLDFKPVTNNDYPVILPFIQRKQSRVCDATFGALYFWKDYYKTHFAIVGDTLFFSSASESTPSFFFLPEKNADFALTCLENHCRALSIPLRLYPIDDTLRSTVECRYGDRARFVPLRDSFDYLYAAADFVSFAGKKYHRQRNHISQFNKCYPNHCFSLLTKEDIPALRAFYTRFITRYPPIGPSAEAESHCIFTWLDDENRPAFLGGCLRVNGEIVGFSLAERLRDTLHVHIEKADVRFSGVYQKLSNAFAAAFCDHTVCFINRQDDLGDEGLRQSKLSYRPVCLLEKNAVSVIL